MILSAAREAKTCTPPRIASPSGVPRPPAEGARPRCTLSHYQEKIPDPFVPFCLVGRIGKPTRGTR
jgi:hypothetical protein